LRHYSEKFGEPVIENAIEACLENSATPVSLLEIGCGEGRVLLELRKRFPTLQLFGINKKPWATMTGSESLREAALHYKIFTESELQSVQLPEVLFYNAKTLQHESNSLDLVISQVAFHYFERKDILLQDIWRVLKPGGQAFLHIDSIMSPCPDFMMSDTPRFIIYDRGIACSFEKHIEMLVSAGFDLKFRNGGRIKAPNRAVSLIIRKNSAKPLDLKLRFDPFSSFDLTKLNRDEDIACLWGYRSVFHLDIGSE